MSTEEQTLAYDDLETCMVPVRFIRGDEVLVDARGKWDFLYVQEACQRQLEREVTSENEWVNYMCAREQAGTTINLDIHTPVKFVRTSRLDEKSALKWTAGVVGVGVGAYAGYRGYKYVRDIQNRFTLMQDKLFLVDGALRRIKRRSADLREALAQLAQLRLETDQILKEFRIPST